MFYAIFAYQIGSILQAKLLELTFANSQDRDAERERDREREKERCLIEGEERYVCEREISERERESERERQKERERERKKYRNKCKEK